MLKFIRYRLIEFQVWYSFTIGIGNYDFYLTLRAWLQGDTEEFWQTIQTICYYDNLVMDDPDWGQYF